MVSLNTPLSPANLNNLKIGEEVFINGRVYIMRDATLKRIFDEKVQPPVDLHTQIVFFGAPSFKRDDGKYKIISVGVTTGQRMEKYLPGLLGSLGVSAVIAKGELNEKASFVFKENHSVYLLFVGGAAALATAAIQSVERVWWEDLMGEALFEVKVKELGPCFVAIDTGGNDLLNTNKRSVNERLGVLLGE